MKVNDFQFWYKGHQILACHMHDAYYHYYIGLTEPRTIRNKQFDKALHDYFDNDKAITIAYVFPEVYAKKYLYSSAALDFISTRKDGIETAMHLCDAVAAFDYPERDYKEYKFTV
ncbi:MULTISPECIES: hypothetical protein [Lactobacillus]|uniref:Uncharacterized protein n=1 Tax=Lactobacillus xujianguonis TaxID=2495899 RepID=A0A437SSC3_9LACO|nr:MULTISPECIES: hypothetical protein [Lactobacillus]RVU69820.1 hypothetical protein EJK17_11030 [Lactobacillus xujianguonis]RVU73433.1 hypothetical protein EJK20_08065 [Lactobacillus xujianguonis]